MGRYKRGILAVRADTHGNSKQGLMRPGILLPGIDLQGKHHPWEPGATAGNQYLWECYEKDIEDLKHLAGKDEIIVAELGDVAHGTKYPDEAVSTRLSDQMAIAEDNFHPLISLKNVKHVRIVTGTGAHSFGEGSAEYMLAASLAAGYGKDVVTSPHYLLTAFGIECDIAHHGGWPGSRNWLKGNVLRYDVKSRMMDDIQVGIKPPDLVLRAHYHTYVPEIVHIRTRERTYTTWVSISPSYSLLSDHARQITRSISHVCNGMLAYEIINGKILERHEFLHTVDLRRKEIIE